MNFSIRSKYKTQNGNIKRNSMAVHIFVNILFTNCIAKIKAVPRLIRLSIKNGTISKRFGKSLFRKVSHQRDLIVFYYI